MIEFFSPIMALNSAISIQLEINSLNSHQTIFQWNLELV